MASSFPSFFSFVSGYVSALPERFYRPCLPTPAAAPSLIAFNDGLAQTLQLHRSAISESRLTALLSGNQVEAPTFALAYAGHQFGQFVPQLGDGRALLLGEQETRDGKRYELQLKGSGPTPFSRRGDGRAALGPVIREYIISEAMHALGIPTTRSLAIVAMGNAVLRETALPGAVLTRVASSHIRIGTFEYFAARNDREAVTLLADYTLRRHYPQACADASPYRLLLNQAIDAQASLVAHWMRVGFIHGVMNTDNMTLSGETLDYGPCAFLDDYDPHKTFSSIDVQGRYAYSNQPRIAQWNLARLAETLLPLLGEDPQRAVAEAEEAINAFPERYQHYAGMQMRRKLGLLREEREDQALIQALLKNMHAHSADYTQTFRMLASAGSGDSVPIPLQAVLEAGDENGWLARWQARLAREPHDRQEQVALMLASNPAYIPRNHRVEEVIASALEGDYQPMHTLMRVLAKPYEEHPEFAEYAMPPRAEEVVTATFCGT